MTKLSKQKLYKFQDQKKKVHIILDFNNINGYGLKKKYTDVYLKLTNHKQYYIETLYNINLNN